MSDAEDSDQGELMPSESSHSSIDGKGTGEKEAGHLNGQGVLSSVEGICDDGICRSDQLPTLLPKMDAPSTPSNSNSALGTPSHQYTHIPGREGGATPTPIQPYLQYYPGMMPGFSAPLQADALLTGANSNPYNYADVSNLSDPIPDTRRNRGGVTEPFPEKLHRMLEQTERDGLTDVVSFFTHGRAFAIHKPKRFQTEIMPTYFKQTRLTSFQRQ